MSAAYDIRFVVSGGGTEGLGHVMRCATLAREAHRRDLTVAFALRGDESARRALRAELPEISIEPWRSPQAFGGPARWTLFDTPSEISVDLAAARAEGERVLVLDRTDHLDDADLTILPVAHAAALDHPRALQGAAYCVVSPCFRDAPPPPYPGFRNRVLVTLGGADPWGATEKVCSALTAGSLADPALERHGVIGPAFRAGDELARRLLALGWTVHLGPSRPMLRELMAHSLCAVTGFGITLAELAFMGVPMLYLTHHHSDLESAARLEETGLGACAGHAAQIDPVALGTLLERSLAREVWRRQCSQRGRELLGDGRGAARILDAMATTGSGGVGLRS